MRDGVHLLLRLLGRHAVSQAPDDAHHVVAATFLGEIGGERDHGLRARRKIRVGRDTDDDVRNAIKADRTADERGIRTETLAPE